ncbi:FKBP-type peptidyl-prolyl cis-trans isomerase [Amycolatopsis acidiphila]|uniref:Peptidyl-prolyl cis-trans isomerase n=1 Tax=Amycolatopsis acidiphila TaxID=715473 RepID=A0A558A3Y6_9PSEU|nr:FKBP-type peptidyl-prolyl cis-trans isomerase [Amycolatopsis acidiphila]TVT18991.1 FKBP-type peptidyl-prolyl cis-trans isomerase [Amycolatopsis acidiphila]UIJ56679.1 FKBP-type peptidyl-prolyl cis-trans isomerase [Amycolatopsis acidiphila]GHG55831.1 peptidyl-prolyl cis-trans isomerase [Amycolatopsis acidiphila]
MRNAGKIMIVVAAALSIAACSPHQEPSSYPPGDGPTYPAPNPAGVSASAAAAPTTQQLKPCTADDVKVTGQFGSKPTVTIPDTCGAPTTLLTEDLQPGTGPAAKNGSQLQVNYDLYTWSDKVDQQNSFASGAFPLTLGQGSVIQGWDEGLVGVKQGGRRLLIIPPDKGYGATGNQSIKPNETLVFVVDAVKVTG